MGLHDIVKAVDVPVFSSFLGYLNGTEKKYLRSLLLLAFAPSMS